MHGDAHACAYVRTYVQVLRVRSFHLRLKMERRKLYNRVPTRLPSTTRWRYANSVREHDSVSLEDSLSFAEALLSGEASHVEGEDDIDTYFEEPSTLTGMTIAAKWL